MHDSPQANEAGQWILRTHLLTIIEQFNLDALSSPKIGTITQFLIVARACINLADGIGKSFFRELLKR